MSASVSALSLEYIKVPIRAMMNGSLYNPTSDVVDFSIVPVGQNPGTWTAGSWETSGTVYYAKITVGPGSTIGALSTGEYSIWVRVHDNPEVPVLQATGNLTVY